MEHGYNYTISNEINQSALPANVNDCDLRNDRPLIPASRETHTVCASHSTSISQTHLIPSTSVLSTGDFLRPAQIRDDTAATRLDPSSEPIWPITIRLHQAASPVVLDIR
jgi:hypothetical protein